MVRIQLYGGYFLTVQLAVIKEPRHSLGEIKVIAHDLEVALDHIIFGLQIGVP